MSGMVKADSPYLDAAISTRATPAQVASAQLSGVVKSIQRGTAAITTDGTGYLSTTVAIAAVNVNKSEVILNGVTPQGTSGFRYARAWLASSSSVGVAMANGNSGAAYGYVDWQVTEFY